MRSEVFGNASGSYRLNGDIQSSEQNTLQLEPLVIHISEHEDGILRILRKYCWKNALVTAGSGAVEKSLMPRHTRWKVGSWNPIKSLVCDIVCRVRNAPDNNIHEQLDLVRGNG